MAAGPAPSAWRASGVVTKERAVGREAAAAKRRREADAEPPPAATAAAPAASAAAAAAPAAAKPAPAAKRPLPAAFAPRGPHAAVLFVGNMPLTAPAAAVEAVLARFGGVRRVHLETNNSGKPAGFAYVEFSDQAAASAALRATAAAGGRLVLDGRQLSLQAYTAASNYRNPDGSRRKRAKGGDR